MHKFKVLCCTGININKRHLLVEKSCNMEQHKQLFVCWWNIHKKKGVVGGGGGGGGEKKKKKREKQQQKTPQSSTDHVVSPPVYII